MNGDPSAGKAPCEARARVSLTTTPDAWMMGEAAAAIRTIFAAVHRVNRRGGGHRVMLDAPAFDPGRDGLLRLGGRFDVMGAPDHVRAVLADATLAQLVRNGALKTSGVEACAPPSHGLVRIRRGEKSTSAGIARARRRAERRGTPWEVRPHRGAFLNGPDGGTAFVTLGQGRKIEVARIEAPLDPQVSTYGML